MFSFEFCVQTNCLSLIYMVRLELESVYAHAVVGAAPMKILAYAKHTFHLKHYKKTPNP